MEERGYEGVEPVPGMLEGFAWTGTIPVSGEIGPEFQAIDAAVETCLRTQGIVGCGIGLVEEDRLLYARGFGWAELGVMPFTPDTACRVGSISKSLTGAAVLRLYAMGEIDLEEPALPILLRGGLAPFDNPDHARNPPWNAIRVRDLLDHTSGLPNSTPYTAFPAIAKAMQTSWLTASDIVRYAWGTTTPTHASGVHYAYANANFVTLGRILEIVTEQDYEAVVHALVLAPMGIGPKEAFVSKATAAPHDPARRANEAYYYQTNSQYFDSLFEETDRKVSEPYGGFDPASTDAGGGWAMTTSGLCKFVANLGSARSLLASNAITALTTPPGCAVDRNDVYPNRQRFYSKGFAVQHCQGVPRLGHAGMLQHAGAVFLPIDRTRSLVALSCCNMREAPWVDARLRDGVLAGLTASR